MSDGVTQRQTLADGIRSGHLHSTRRRRLITMLLVTLGVLVCLAVLVLLELRPSDGEIEVDAPNNVSENFGFTLTPELATNTDEIEGALIPVAIYEDFLCDSCKIFHEQTGDFLDEQVAAGNISITYHPFTFMLTQSSDEYSQRASNAAVCVADQAGVPAYAKMHDLLLTHQPAHGGPGLADEQLIEFAEQAGAEDVADCIQDRTFSAWVEQAMKAGLTADVSQTPTVRVDGLTVIRSVDGRESMPGPEELQFAIEANQ